MGFLSNKIEKEDLKPGDHIYVWRKRSGLYFTHHGIYVGGEGDDVINLTRGESCDELNASPFLPAEGPVGSCSLDAFLSDGKLHRFEYGVNALYFLAKLWGTCTRASSDSVEDVLRRATSLCRDGFGDYDLTNNNCEDFALYCKTGLLDVVGSRKTSSSGQIAFFVGVVASVFAYIFMPRGFLPTSIVGTALMFCFLICNSRLHFDAGARNTYILEKVSVEDLRQLSHPDIAWKELGIIWILILAVLAFIAWYWNPKSLILLCVRSFVLYVLLSLILIGFLRNHRFKLYVFVLNYTLLLIVWHWNPESNDLQGIRRILLVGMFIVLFVHPMIDRCSRLWQLIEPIIFLFVFWYWTPESTILQWVKIFLIATTIPCAVFKITMFSTALCQIVYRYLWFGIGRQGDEPSVD